MNKVHESWTVGNSIYLYVGSGYQLHKLKRRKGFEVMCEYYDTRSQKVAGVQFRIPKSQYRGVASVERKLDAGYYG